MDYELIFLKIPAQNIVLLKFILESYEGLCVLRTLNSARGEVVLIALPDTVETLEKVLENLESLTGFRKIPAPSKLDEDWLLREFFSLNTSSTNSPETTNLNNSQEISD